jgi:site-specific DNA-methyltransferase (adenine-specific)
MNIIHGDSLDKLKELEDNSVDSIVTDPPYGLSFMGKKWDYDVPSQEIWEECLRVLKPGGYLLAFAGTRTQHRMAVRIEDAGFEIRDMIAWVYGSGFPKSLNIGKAVDKLQGNERENVGVVDSRSRYNSKNRKSTGLNIVGSTNFGKQERKVNETKGTSEWEGWGTALKPALEPITVARKPFKGSVAQNVLKWGTGGINIDGCRVEGADAEAQGRFPANLIHDGSDEVVGLFPNTKGEIGRAGRKTGGNYEASSYKVGVVTKTGIKDSGSASRFFYCPKASKSERNKGCEELEFQTKIFRPGNGLGGQQIPAIKQNHHPTVKPISLMRYLCRLVTPKGGTVLDPFMGSGTTGIGAKLEGFDFIGIEREEEYIKIAEARINAWEENKQKKLIQ